MDNKKITIDGTPYTVVYSQNEISILKNDKIARTFKTGDLIAFERDAAKNLIWVAPIFMCSTRYDYLLVADASNDGKTITVPLFLKKFCELNAEFDVSAIDYDSRYIICTAVEWYKSSIRISNEINKSTNK
jgi:hypothetical protein